MRRQRRDLRVGDRLVDHRTVGRQRLVPGVGHPVGRLHPDPLQAQQLGIAGEREVGQHLRGVQLRVARQHALLPGDLVEVVVVEDQHHQLGVAPALVVAGDVDQRVDAQHLHRSVAQAGDHGAVGIGELGGQGIGHARAHRGQRARERGLHPPAQAQVPGPPVGGRARVGGEDAVVGELGRELVEHPLRVDRVGVHHGLLAQDPPPALDALLDLLAPGALRRQDRVRWQAIGEFKEDEFGIEWFGWLIGPFLDNLPPVGDLFLNLLAPLTIRLAL